MLLTRGTEQETADLKLLHENYSLILRLISSKAEKIDIQAFKKLCSETYLHQVQAFPWATVPQSIHRILAHAAEAIQQNGGFGLGALSEEGLEATHKLVRRFRALLSRKTSLEDNLYDVFKHLWVRSDPVIRLHTRVLSCTFCDAQGHTKRTCSKRFHNCDTEEESRVLTFFLK